MARITRDIKRLAKETTGLLLDVASATVTVAVGTASVARKTIEGTTVDNLKNVVTYSCDVVAGNEIGTANDTLTKAIDNGDFGKQVAEYVLDTVHGDATYRAEAKKITDKIAIAENELDALLLQAELAQLELEANKEIARLNKEVKANQTQTEA